LLLVSISSELMFVGAGIALAADEIAGQGKTNLAAQPLIDFPLTRSIVILGIVLLMVFLFFFIFIWQQRVEQSSYFSDIFHEKMIEIGTNRLSAPYLRKLSQGGYLAEILLQPSERGALWLAENKKPNANDPKYDDLPSVANDLGYPYTSRLQQIEFSMTEMDSYTDSTYGAPARPSAGPGVSPFDEGRSVNEDQKKRQAGFLNNLGQFDNDAREWKDRAKACAMKWYQKDIPVQLVQVH
jgi:hypothetical protein